MQENNPGLSGGPMSIQKPCLPIHPDASLAHEAALGAGGQGKFWQMHDLLFQKQAGLRPERLLNYSNRLGQDVTAFTQAVEEERRRALVCQTPWKP